MNDHTLRYSEAVRYACECLGDELASRHFPRLHSLARTLSSTELESIIRGWRPAPAPEPEPVAEPQPKPVAAPAANTAAGGSCKHYGGDKECPTCLRESTRAGVILAGAMKLADEMFQKHRKFVQARVRGECLPFTGGEIPSQSQQDDIEQKVWHKVAASIAQFTDYSHPLAWLTTITHSVVINHFRGEFAQKRDIRLTDQFPEDDAPDHPEK